MADKHVPYADGMKEGQGFNTYLQNGCMYGAVEVTRQPRSGQHPNAVEVTYNSEKVTRYEKLAQSLEISAGAGVSKMGIGGSIDTKFISRSEFETSFLTYIVRVDVRQQPGPASHYHFNWVEPRNPNEAYGDRFISDFVKGGALFARVSISTSDSTIHKEIEESAKAGFPMYGVDVQVTQAMRSSTDKICKNSDVKIYIHYVGAPPGYRPDIALNEDDNAFIQLKNTADKFLADAQKQDYMRYALLEKYTNIPDFKNQFEPLDYSDAEQRSWAVFNDFSEYFAIRDTILGVEDGHYEGGRATKEKLMDHENDVLKVYITWVTNVSADPDKAMEPPHVQLPEKFLKEVLSAVHWTQYIAQSLPVKPSGRTHIIYEKLQQHARELFGLRGFSFGDVLGTAKLSFGKKHGQDKYVCLIGREMTPGYDELSHLWVFEKPVKGASDLIVNVYDYPAQGVIELEQPNANSNDPLFTFHAGVA